MAQLGDMEQASISRDLLWGPEEIGEEIRRTKRQVQHMIDRGDLVGAKKIGGRWCITRSALHALFYGKEAAGSMAHKRTKPATSISTSTGSGWNSLAASNRDNTETLSKVQAEITPPRAAIWLARRHRLSIETAVAIVTANGLGGSQ